MAMNEEMIDAYNDAFHEIDFDYEFDAPRYFDFTRDEFLDEAFMAEAWFLSAKTYPHSPLVSKMIRQWDNPHSNDKVSESTGMECSPRLPIFPSFVGTVRELPSTDAFHSGRSEENTIKNDVKDEVKMVKHLCRSSTLMKPTASHLSKQNARHVAKHGYSRFPINPSKDKSLNSSSIEMQAFKRQKLDGGQCQKVSATNQLPDLIHKAPKKDEILSGKALPPKLKLTIPKDPVLGTAKRAHRIISKTQQKNDRQVEHGFKALPLNRKILERPSLLLPKRSTPQLPEFQVFHLRTAERALQHSSSISNQNYTCNTMRNEYVTSRRTHDSDDQKQYKFTDSSKFKATPLDKKIYSTNHDCCVFGRKQIFTTQKEFNFQQDNKLPSDPPVELFNKLSLCPGVQSGDATQMKFPRPNKVSKENRLGVLQESNGWDRSPYGCVGGRTTVGSMPIVGSMQVL